MDEDVPGQSPQVKPHGRARRVFGPMRAAQSVVRALFRACIIQPKLLVPSADPTLSIEKTPYVSSHALKPCRRGIGKCLLERDSATSLRTCSLLTLKSPLDLFPASHRPCQPRMGTSQPASIAKPLSYTQRALRCGLFIYTSPCFVWSMG